MNDGSVERFVARLRETERRIVFAESCTAGRIAATLGEVPGVSEVLVGSAVVYQELTKCRWLGVNEASITEHGVVSETVSIEMAEGVLRKTPHANISASITGHLGPNAPSELDGVAWCAVAIRSGGAESEIFATEARKLVLEQQPDDPSGQLRRRRIEEAVQRMLDFCAENCAEKLPVSPE